MTLASNARLTRKTGERIPTASLARLLALGVFFVLVPIATGAFAAPCGSGPGERVTIAAVGERLEFALADGRQVRLAGLDLPDPGRGDPATAAAARAFATDWLAGHEAMLLILSPKSDRWGRVLADLEAPPLGQAGAPPVSVALAALAAGFARVWPEPEARPCLDERRKAEALARENRLGLWRDPYYGVVIAADLENLRKRDGQFTLVEGTPSRVGEGRSRFYVDFDLHRGFTVVIPKRRAKAFEQAGAPIQALKGAKIRVRGALDNRFGLRMEITEPEAVERIE